MNTFFRFFYEFISVFFDGLFSGLKGLWDGITEMFGVDAYSKIISSYKDSFNGNEKIFVVICIIFLLIFVVTFALLIFFTIKAIIRKFGNEMNNEELLD